jgi:two-component system, OmpR family, response regulator VicR
MADKGTAHRILIIEDDKDTNDLVSSILGDEGFVSIPAYDGEEGLLKAEKEQPDVIILDLMLPKIDGIEVCRLLTDNEKTRSIPVIILTAKHELSTKLSSFVAGAKRFLTKPFDRQELITEVNRTIRQRQLATPDHDTPLEHGG